MPLISMTYPNQFYAAFFTYSSFLLTTAIILAYNLFFKAFNTIVSSNESHCVGIPPVAGQVVYRRTRRIN